MGWDNWEVQWGTELSRGEKGKVLTRSGGRMAYSAESFDIGTKISAEHG